MPVLTSKLGGLNLYTNPLMDPSTDGQIIRAVNLDSSPYGAKNKRGGYAAFLGTPDNSTIIDLFDWRSDGGTAPTLYRNSGGQLYYSAAGTGAWTPCGNGVITAGSHVGYAVLNNTLIISQNGGTTRHTTNGTSFTDTSGAPAGEQVKEYQGRIHITGTDSFVNYSVARDPTNWSASGTSDSSNFFVPGAGKNNKLLKLADRLFITKEGRNMFRWDGFSLVDTSSNSGPSSPYSYGSVETNGFWLNEKGVFTSQGGAPQLISNPIFRYFQNTNGSQIAGTSFGSAPATIHYYDYTCAVGSMTEDLTNETVPNAIIKYNFQKNEWLNWSFADFPTAWLSYRDSTSMPQLIFGNTNGQVFQMGTQTSDNGKPIESIIELMFDYGNPAQKKDWRILWGFFNPGCGAQVQIATSNTFIKENKKWQVIGPAKEGVVESRFTHGERSRFLYVKITESSRDPAYECYGIAIEADLVPIQ